jgi:hypothetical protein
VVIGTGLNTEIGKATKTNYRNGLNCYFFRQNSISHGRNRRGKNAITTKTRRIQRAVVKSMYPM